VHVEVPIDVFHSVSKRRVATSIGRKRKVLDAYDEAGVEGTVGHRRRSEWRSGWL
jgi:hypothetical protein